MYIETKIQLGETLLGTLKVYRTETLGNPGRDLMKYAATFCSREWNEGKFCKPIGFRHRFSYGVLSLHGAAVRALLKAYPQLRAGRPGKPRNRIQCRKCKQIIWSRDRHEMVTCRCGAVSVDGGYDYCRTGGHRKNIKVLREPWEK